MNLHLYKATLADNGGRHPIYDADTMRIDVDHGFGARLDLGNCRLYGINAPEMRGVEREKGIKARDYVRQIMEENPEFVIETFKDDKKGKYGRYLIKVWFNDGTCLNETLVEKGFAKINFY